MARTRAVDFEEKQRGILTSAAAVFAEVGMEKASMSMIASHSNVSKALLYHYYPCHLYTSPRQRDRLSDHERRQDK